MSQAITITDSKTVLWSLKKRFRVGESVSYNGYFWTNNTGINTEPGADVNWIQGPSESGKVVILIVNGNIFQLRKSPSNNDPLKQTTLEKNDMAVNGFWDATIFWPIAIFIGADKDVYGDWNPLGEISEIVLV